MVETACFPAECRRFPREPPAALLVCRGRLFFEASRLPEKGGLGPRLPLYVVRVVSARQEVAEVVRRDAFTAADMPPPEENEDEPSGQREETEEEGATHGWQG